MDRYGTGKRGELDAREYLASLGYEIVAENVGYHKLGELDIVALDNRTLVIVEVKYREDDTFAHPLESITPHKKTRILRAAARFISECRLSYDEIRFDVVFFLYGKLEHVKSAFYGRYK
jgi:putative endonuclease